MLLSWGWNARKVAAGGGGINVVITCIHKKANKDKCEVYQIFSSFKININNSGEKKLLSTPTSYSRHSRNTTNAYLKGHHVEQWHFSSRCWHDIRIILWKRNTGYCFLRIWRVVAYIVGHKNTTRWLPELGWYSCRGLQMSTFKY